ncbi:hypothetical protein J4573_17435 [Actinomadura barringtoniae]|uniref:Peptidase n=1 Tax=Actinomadura barringtoniae TaxID=1427535 RepID=A0A939PHZ7_9ACTN|nr:hypothetical protein [Actinomadura barringtoniae]MBO2448891.1 hypothetical protein [Actinomadura barringtoniae]
MRLQLLATASAVALSFGVTVDTAHADDQSSATVGRATAAMSSAANAFWTPENMAAATPLDALEAPSGDVPSAPSTQTESADGSAPAQAATFGADSLTYFWQSKAWAGHGAAPARTIGKLYFDKDGARNWCTATVISSANHNTVWTAAHCLSDGNGHWYKNILFAPDYHDGQWPYGHWAAKSWAVPEGYHHGKNKVHDMGAVALNTSSGRRVGDVVGWQGYKFGSTQAFTDSRSFGYPVDTFPARSGIDSNGADLRFCVGSSTLEFWRKLHCDMGHGASGGPTIYDMPLSRGWGYIVTNQSWVNPSNPGYTFGPQLGDNAINVHNAVQAD